MSLKSCGYRLQKIKGAEDQGQVGLCSGLFFLLFLSVILMSQLQLEEIRASDAYLQDALAASGLACAIIDIPEYGRTHEIRIEDPKAAYEQYCRSLRANLGLDDNWECPNKHLISGRVSVENFTVYQVSGAEVTMYRMDGGREEIQRGELGSVCAPNGQIIEHTGVYGEISYPLKGLFGLEVAAKKGKLVDIVGES